MSSRSIVTEQRSVTTLISEHAVQQFTEQQIEEKEEMRTLNNRLSTHIDHVRGLEEENIRLRKILDSLKSQWGFDSGQVKDQYDDKLLNIRKQIDDCSNQKALDELAAKRADNDAREFKHAIDFANQRNVADHDRLTTLRRQEKAAKWEVESLTERLAEKQAELERDRARYENLRSSYDKFKDNLDDESIRRVMLQNELQSIEEQIAFMKAVYEEEKNELISLGAVPVETTNFYDDALTRTIRKIDEDFKNLAKDQKDRWKNYYNEKTEAFLRTVDEQRKRIDAENRRTVAIRSNNLPDVENRIIQEQEINSRLCEDYEQLLHEINSIEDEIENLSNRKQRDNDQRELDQQNLERKVQEIESQITAITDGNVSLKSEIQVYRRLLGLDVVPPPVIEPVEENRTMTVHKQAQGIIVIDEVDPEGNFIVVENNGSNGREQDLTGWTIRRKVDAQPVVTFSFPDTFTLQPRARVRVLASDAPQTSADIGEVLVAQHIPNWGFGETNTTKVFDQRNVQKAILKQSFT